MGGVLSVGWMRSFQVSLLAVGIMAVSSQGAGAQVAGAPRGNSGPDSWVSGKSLTPGTVIAWGSNNPSGQATVPEAARTGVTAIAAGSFHSLALRNGGVISWGWEMAMPDDARSGVTAIAAGGYHSLALKNGGVIAWGVNLHGETTVPEAARTGVTAIAAGRFQSLALKDGGVIAWGSGRGAVPESARSGVTAIAAGEHHYLALTRFGEVIAWGGNQFGQATVPESARSGVTAIAAFEDHSMALKNGEVIAWGRSQFGQATVPESARSGVSAIAAGGYQSLALKDGGVIAWGNDDYGRSVVPVTARSGVTAIAAGYAHSLAIRPVLGPPSPPIDVAGAAGDGLVTVSWSLAHTSEPATQFQVTAFPGGQSCSSEDSKCTVRGLSNGIAYAFTVTATNTFGTSAPSQPSPAVTPQGRPWPPNGPSGTAGNGEVLVSWQPPISNGGYPLSGYVVASTPGSQTCTTTGALSCKVGGLDNGVSYTFAVVAQNQAGASVASAESDAVTPNDSLATPPRGVSGTAGNGSVTLQWHAPIDAGDSPVTFYTATASPSGQDCTTTGALSCTIAGLSNDSSYTFTVTATNAAGTSLPSDPTSPLTPRAPITKPGPVADLNAAASKGSIHVTWSPPSDLGGGASITYQYKVGRKPWKSISATSVSVNGKKDSRIIVKVRAVNEAGAGPARTVSATPR